MNASDRFAQKVSDGKYLDLLACTLAIVQGDGVGHDGALEMRFLDALDGGPRQHRVSAAR